jgi:hypothetical protein
MTAVLTTHFSLKYKFECGTSSFTGEKIWEIPNNIIAALQVPLLTHLIGLLHHALALSPAAVLVVVQGWGIHVSTGEKFNTIAKLNQDVPVAISAFTDDVSLFELIASGYVGQ